MTAVYVNNRSFELNGGLGCRVNGSRFRIQGLGVQGSRAYSKGLKTQVIGLELGLRNPKL